MYEFIDEVGRDKNDRTRKKFNNLRLGLMKNEEKDPVKIRKKVDRMFLFLEKDDMKYFLLLIAFLEEKGMDLTGFLIEMFLEEYNATLLFVYKNEVERKKMRYAEAITAIANSTENGIMPLLSDTSMQLQKWNTKNWSSQFEEVAVDMERAATVYDMEKRGVKKIMWVTKGDERVCSECRELNGRIFPVGKLPPRPHRGCRCTFKEVKSK